MPDPRKTRTMAADTAPGVDDGRSRRVPGPPVDSKPSGRKFIIPIVLVIAVIALIASFVQGSGRQHSPAPPAAATSATPGP